MSDCNALANGTCGLTDGSVAYDWRLPNIKELQSLIDYGRWDPALPSGHLFSGVQSQFYWSSTTCANDPESGAWGVNFKYGYVDGGRKTSHYYVWPVRGGN